MSTTVTVTDTDTESVFTVEAYEGYVHFTADTAHVGDHTLTASQTRALAATLEHFANCAEFDR